jgi:hypothetical protein
LKETVFGVSLEPNNLTFYTGEPGMNTLDKRILESDFPDVKPVNGKRYEMASSRP